MMWHPTPMVKLAMSMRAVSIRLVSMRAVGTRAVGTRVLDRSRTRQQRSPSRSAGVPTRSSAMRSKAGSALTWWSSHDPTRYSHAHSRRFSPFHAFPRLPTPTHAVSRLSTPCHAFPRPLTPFLAFPRLPTPTHAFLRLHASSPLHQVFLKPIPPWCTWQHTEQTLACQQGGTDGVWVAPRRALQLQTHASCLAFFIHLG